MYGSLMTPEDFLRIRKTVLHVTQAQLGDLIDRKPRQIANYEKGNSPIPKGVALAMAWLAVFGSLDPYEEGWRPPFKTQ